ncbi:hypothetical protein V1512DRAFT_246823 [Lipomyces arxii]|uniref:uncharacterized protein n=1 Tax=Lipomyces arxii TaxID=56418 RepID=UPI0034CDC9B5
MSVRVSDTDQCWICFGTSTDPVVPPATEHKWRKPCKCNLVAHEECILAWIGPIKTSIECPQCKYVIKVQKSKSYFYRAYKYFISLIQWIATTLEDQLKVLLYALLRTQLLSLLGRVSIALVFPMIEVRHILFIESAYRFYHEDMTVNEKFPGLNRVPKSPYFSLLEILTYTHKLSRIPNIFAYSGTQLVFAMIELWRDVRAYSSPDHGQSVFNCFLVFPVLVYLHIQLRVRLLDPWKDSFVKNAVMLNSEPADTIVEPVEHVNLGQDVEQEEQDKQENTDFMSSEQNIRLEEQYRLEPIEKNHIGTEEIKQEAEYAEIRKYEEEEEALEASEELERNIQPESRLQAVNDGGNDNVMQQQINEIVEEFMYEVSPLTEFTQDYFEAFENTDSPAAVPNDSMPQEDIEELSNMLQGDEQALEEDQIEVPQAGPEVPLVQPEQVEPQMVEEAPIELELPLPEPIDESELMVESALLPLACRLTAELICFFWPEFKQLVPYLFLRCYICMILDVLVADLVKVYMAYQKAQEVNKRKVLDYQQLI